MHLRRTLAAMATLTLLTSIIIIGPVSGAKPGIQTISDSQLKAQSATLGGAKPVANARTVANWWGSTLDTHDGVTYGYNMVGANPHTCSGSACNVTVETDITPIIVNVAGLTFSGNNVLAATLASPQFATNDYGTTAAATGDVATESRGAGGALSQLDAGVALQLEDATMRAQFNKTGSGSTYHLRLHANVLPAVTINVPSNQGTLLQSGRGVIFADVNISWWGSQMKNLMTKADPTHLPLYLTSDVLLHIGPDIFNCCVIGFHGAQTQNTKSQGNAKIQTFAWASYMSPGIYARPNGGANWALQDIHALSHEIAEWGDDPFVNNGVEPWLTPTAPQYGCTDVLETGDPVVGIGFAMGNNTYLQNPNPWTSPTDHNPSVSVDGFWHPEDEALLPWFMRSSPNNISEPTQTTSANGGRYTFMGDLNPAPGFRAPATGC
jgi:hypothetical protein